MTLNLSNKRSTRAGWRKVGETSGHGGCYRREQNVWKAFHCGILGWFTSCALLPTSYKCVPVAVYHSGCWCLWVSCSSTQPVKHAELLSGAVQTKRAPFKIRLSYKLWKEWEISTVNKVINTERCSESGEKLNGGDVWSSGDMPAKRCRPVMWRAPALMVGQKKHLHGKRNNAWQAGQDSSR